MSDIPGFDHPKDFSLIYPEWGNRVLRQVELILDYEEPVHPIAGQM